MKIKFLLVMLLPAYTISAQLAITPGAQFSISGNMHLTLQNTDLVCNGNFTTGNSIISFSGDAPSSISGSQPVQFNELQMNKINNSSVLLQKPIGVGQRILFTSGFLNLNGFNADLGSSGHLYGEQENSRITGSNGGEVLFNVNLTAPAGVNPANLGIFISSDQNLGNITIKRGHQSQVNIAGTGASILRYYEIVPAGNTDLNATLRFNYIDGELNGQDENAILPFQSKNFTDWTSLGFTLKDVVANVVETTGISSFGRFTLSNANGPLPVRFVLLNARCEQNKILISWKTAQEQNSSHFNMEKSNDGLLWRVIGNIPAAGNSSNERNYSFTDNDPKQNNYYRIAEYELNGRPQYSNVLPAACNTTDLVRLWPNPVRNMAFINIVAGNQSQATVKVFDSKGALVIIQKATVLPGGNQLSVDMKMLANGSYQFSIVWDNARMQRTMQILKQ